jgi:redox-sensitive bicupin YhaK (pirin superfamily)
MHHHEEMEIISIPLAGGVAHKDSKGSSGITSVNKEEGYYTVQQMTAGSGISHSEFNASKTDSVRFLQIWISPNKQNLTPTYNQRQFAFSNQHDKWQTLIAPKDSGAIHINQEAVFSIADIDAGKKL